MPRQYIQGEVIFAMYSPTNWNLLNHVNPISLLCFSVIIYEFIL